MWNTKIVENTEIQGNIPDNSISGTPQLPVKKSFPVKIVLIIIILLLILSIALFFVHEKKATNTSNQTGKQKTQTTLVQKSLPKNNILIYTRCFGGERQPNNCKLYVSSLQNQPEDEIYSFDFPKIQQTDYKGGFNLNIYGIVDKTAVYTKSYWEKKDKEQTEYNILGAVNLTTGEDSIIYKQVRYPSKNSTRNEQDNGVISSVYLDNTTNRVYYTTEIGPGTGGKITHYDLATKQNNVVADDKKLDNTYKVEDADKNKLYLSYSNDYITGNYQISKILDLTTGVVTNTAKQWYNAVINKQGTKVAYVDQTVDESNRTFNLSLKVSDLEGKDVKEIYAIPNTRLLADGYNGSYPYAFVSNFFFDEFGDRLSFTVHRSKLEGAKYSGETINNYVSFLEVRHAQPGEKGIILEQQDNPNLYKTLVEVKPIEQKYRWVKFLTYEGPIQGNPEDGALYELDGVWYLKEAIGLDEQKQEINLLVNRKALLINAKNVFLIP